MWPFARRPNIERLVERRDAAGLARALRHPEASVRQAAAVGLTTCDATVATAPLIEALADREPAVRAAAIEALGKLDASVALPLLTERLRRSDATAPALLAALGRLAAHAEARAVLEANLHGPNPRLRAAAARALGRRGDAVAVPPLLRSLGDPDGGVVQAAQEALVVVGVERALGPLGEALRDEHAPVRAAAAHVLGHLSDPRAVTPLAEALADPNPAVRAAALGALVQLPEPGREIALLADTSLDSVERERAAQRLRQIGAAPPLIGALQAVDHPGLRAAAARALVRLGAPEAVPALTAALADPEPAVRQEAAWMLGVMGQPAALEPLLTLLRESGEAALRATAARALGRLGQAQAIPALEAASQDPEPAVAASAARALTMLRRGPAAAAAPEHGAGALQVVLFMPDPAPEDRSTYAARLLDEAAPGALAGGADVQVVTMQPGRPVPPLDEARLILRRQFRTPPPGFAWQPTVVEDEQGRACLVMQLVPAAPDEA